MCCRLTRRANPGRVVLHTFFRGTSLREINVIGAGGDDRLMLCNFDSPVPAYVWGDGGDDAIDAVVFGAVRGTGLFAGDGNDVVRAGGYPKAGFLVWGEGGDDTITGSIAADTIYGDDNDPREWVKPFGNDVIYGGDGDDMLCGCAGNDAIYGQNGNDFLDGGEDADMLDGGAGEDFGVYDELDKMIDIELTTK